MSSEMNVEIKDGSASQTYVVEGAALSCSLGSDQSSLQLPKGHGIFIKGKKRANIADHTGGMNILSFGSCSRSDPPPPCAMATVMKWVNGKENVLVDSEPALQSSSLNLCAYGGVISIVTNGQ